MNKNKTFITLTLLLLSSVATTPGFSKEAKKEEKETRSAEEKDFNKELKDLIALDFDLIESYDSAFKRLESETYKEKLKEFKTDHQKNIDAFSDFFREKGETPPTAADAGKYVAKGKVALARLVGDKTILRALRSNESNTNDAYTRMNGRSFIPQDMKDSLSQGLQDKARHLAWFDEVLK